MAKNTRLALIRCIKQNLKEIPYSDKLFSFGNLYSRYTRKGTAKINKKIKTGKLKKITFLWCDEVGRRVEDVCFSV